MAKPCILNSSPSIADPAFTEESLFTQIPPHQGPTFSIHCDWGQGGPDLPAVNINHIERGFSSLTAVLFIQGQGTERGLLSLSKATHGIVVLLDATVIPFESIVEIRVGPILPKVSHAEHLPLDTHVFRNPLWFPLATLWRPSPSSTGKTVVARGRGRCLPPRRAGSPGWCS